jgi:hypothetical protein
MTLLIERLTASMTIPLAIHEAWRARFSEVWDALETLIGAPGRLVFSHLTVVPALGVG